MSLLAQGSVAEREPKSFANCLTVVFALMRSESTTLLLVPACLLALSPHSALKAPRCCTGADQLQRMNADCIIENVGNDPPQSGLRFADYIRDRVPASNEPTVDRA
jgi:hypothetical protein